MSFRFWRRIQLFPGVTLNLSKSNVSLSLGPRGASYTLSPRGNRATIGLPGTGLFYTVKDPFKDKGRKGGQGSRQSTASPAPPVPVKDRLTLGFFKRLVTPDDEEAFVDGLRALHQGETDQALNLLEAAANRHIDARWMAGILHLQRQQPEPAIAQLRAALDQPQALGQLFAKYQVTPTISFAVTDEVTAHIQPRLRGTRLALAELHQAQDDHQQAEQLLRKHLTDTPDDLVARAALAELLLDADPITREQADAVIKLATPLDNETPVHAALLLYKARALRALDMDHAAITTFTQAYRRKKGRSEELLEQIRFERALAYRAIGKRSRARQELEALYAQAPDFPGLAAAMTAEQGQ